MLRLDALGDNLAAKDVAAQITPRIHREAAAEKTRLLDVAATRAKRVCHLAWGAIKDAESSGTAWLFHGLSVSPEDWEQGRDQLKLLQAPARIGADLHGLVDPGPSNIQLRGWPDAAPNQWAPPAQETLDLRSLSFGRPLDPSWGIHSFSSLTAGAEHVEKDTDNVAVGATVETPEEKSIHAFPAGAHAGTCLHAVFEHIDFTKPAEIEPEVRRRLLIAGFDVERWAGIVSETVQAVLRAPLGDGLSLDQVEPGRRKVEAEF